MLKLIACGNVVADADLIASTKNDGSQGHRSKFSIAVNRHAKTKEDAPVYINVTLWDNQAQTFSKYIKKNTKVTVEGDFTLNTYVGQDGKEHTNIAMSAPAIEIQGGGYQNTQQAAPATPAPVAAPAEAAPQFTQVEDDEPLPF